MLSQGLGKTFQSISLMYTLLTQGKQDRPAIRRAAVVTLCRLLLHGFDAYEFCFAFQICPTSIVSNWGKEIKKWLGDRLEGYVVEVNCSKREEVIDRISRFCSQVRILFCSDSTLEFRENLEMKLLRAFIATNDKNQP